MKEKVKEERIHELKHEDQIRTEMDKYRPKIRIYTVKECQKKYGAEYEVEKGKENGSVFIMKSGACITGNYPGKEEAHRKAQKEYDEAPLIKDGDLILIDGMIFKVNYTNIRYSDPVHLEFIRYQ